MLTRLLSGSKDLDFNFEFWDVSVTVPELAIDPSDFAFTILSKLEVDMLAVTPPV